MALFGISNKDRFQAHHHMVLLMLEDQGSPTENCGLCIRAYPEAKMIVLRRLKVSTRFVADCHSDRDLSGEESISY